MTDANTPLLPNEGLTQTNLVELRYYYDRHMQTMKAIKGVVYPTVPAADAFTLALRLRTFHQTTRYRPWRIPFALEATTKPSTEFYVWHEATMHAFLAYPLDDVNAAITHLYDENPYIALSW